MGVESVSSKAGDSLAGSFSELDQYKVCVVLLHEGDKGFLIPVFSRASGQDRWFDLPGGKAELDVSGHYEPVSEATRREIEEELGIQEICVTKVFTEVQNHQKTATPRVFVVCKAKNGESPLNAEEGSDQNTGLHLLEPAEAAEILGDRITGEVEDYLLELSSAARLEPAFR